MRAVLREQERRGVKRHKISSDTAIDMHTHSGGPHLARYLRREWPAVQNLRDLVVKAEQNHVDWLVVFPFPYSIFYDPMAVLHGVGLRWSGIGDFPYQFENDYLLYETGLFGRRVLPFLAIDPTRKVDEQLSWLQSKIRETDLYGLKVHTRATGSRATDLLDSPLLGFAQEYDLPLMIHAEGPGSDNASPEHVFRLAAAKPGVRMCIAHTCYFDKTLLPQRLEHPNVCVDVAPFGPKCMLLAVGEHSNYVSNDTLELPYTDPIHTLLELIDMLPGKLVWGTDEPYTILTDESGEVIALSS
jgi:predicted TIM-barrel fold metal-dependent hydrolase